MERLNTDVSSAKIPFEQAPEVFQSVRVNPATDIGFGMVNDLMYKGLIQSLICGCLIGIDVGSVFDILQHSVLQGEARNVRHYAGTNLPGGAIQQPHYCGL